MLIVSICERLGWTYQDYMNQPVWFIDLLLAKMDIDHQRAEKRIKKSNG
jgi:hypothetical protein